MKQINEYIIEKLILDKNISSNKKLNIDAPYNIEFYEFARWLKSNLKFKYIDIRNLNKDIELKLGWKIKDYKLLNFEKTNKELYKEVCDAIDNLESGNHNAWLSISNNSYKVYLGKCDGKYCHDFMIFITNTRDKVLYTYLLDIILQ